MDEETQTVPYFHTSPLDGVIITDSGGGGGGGNNSTITCHNRINNNTNHLNEEPRNRDNKHSEPLTTRAKLASIFSFNAAEKKLFCLRNNKMDEHQQQQQQQYHCQVQNISPNNQGVQSVPFGVTATIANSCFNDNLNNSLNNNNNNNNIRIASNNNNSNSDRMYGVDSDGNSDPNKMDATAVPSTDANFNEMNSVEQFSSSPSFLGERIGGLCVSGSDCRSITIDSADGGQDEINNEQHLLQVIQTKTARINELEMLLRHKENEIAELKSHLDKFQSVFPFSRNRKTGSHGANVQRQRAQGISAEPQSESSVLELLHVTFPKYDKDEK